MKGDRGFGDNVADCFLELRTQLLEHFPAIHPFEFAQLSQPRQTSVFSAPTAGQVAAGAAGQELSNVAVEILRRGMDQAPTITIPQGAPFNVFLNGDLVFDGPYVPEP